MTNYIYVVMMYDKYTGGLFDSDDYSPQAFTNEDSANAYRDYMNKTSPEYFMVIKVALN